jgi:non-ribosomal peptide synthetase component F
LWIARANGPLRQLLTATALTTRLGEEHIYTSVRAAVEAYHAQFGSSPNTRAGGCDNFDPSIRTRSAHTLRPYPERTLLDVMSDTVRQRPGHAALIFKGARMSYARLEQLTNAFGAALVALGVKKGDRVAMLLPNSPQSIIAQLGAWTAGAIAAPINSLYTPRELEQALTEVGPETVVVLTPFYDKLKLLQARTSLRRVIATNIKEYLPGRLRLLFTVAKEKRRASAFDCSRATCGGAT